MAVNKNRFLWADVARIVAIFLVVLNHTSTVPQYPAIQDIPRLLSISLAVVGVPLFVMLSGALLLPKKESYRRFFTKKLLRVLLPWFFWTTVITLFGLDWHKLASFHVISTDWYRTLMSFWFPPIIICLYLVTPAARLFARSAKNIDLLFLLLLAFFMLSLIPYYHPTLAFPIFSDGLVPRGLYYLGYFLAGHLLTRYKISTRFGYFAAGLFVLGLLWTSISMYFASVQNGGQLNESFLGPAAPGVVTTSIALFSMLYVFVSRGGGRINQAVKPVLVRLSTAAFGIYLLHQSLKPMLGKVFMGDVHPVIEEYLYALCLFIVSALIIIILQQIPYLKRLVS